MLAGGCGRTAVSCCCTAAEAAGNSLGAPKEVLENFGREFVIFGHLDVCVHISYGILVMAY